MEEHDFGHRVLALSATPGNDLQKIQVIIKNLSIADIKVKLETDIDVREYIQHKAIIPLVIDSDLNQSKITGEIGDLIKFLCNKLVDNVQGSNEQELVSSIQYSTNIFSVLKLYKSFNSNNKYYKRTLSKQEFYNTHDIFKLLIKVINLKKKLTEQSYDSFKLGFESIEEFINKSYTHFSKNLKQKDIYKVIKESAFRLTDDVIDNHPKMKTLCDLLSEFFANKITIKRKSKAIVFTNERDCCQKIVEMLNQNENIKAKMFVGQATKSKTNMGLTQKQQIQLINSFKNNEINTLVATCVAEEGLDIGEVDFIICYDNGLSPTRLVQRMGRTGRKRAGKVTLLLNPKEYAKYKSTTNKCQKVMMDLRRIKADGILEFYEKSPLMVPDEYKYMELLFEEAINKQETSQIGEDHYNNVEGLIDQLLMKQKGYVEPVKPKRPRKKKTKNKKITSMFQKA